MPQLYSLGGVTIQKLDRLFVSRIKNDTGTHTIMETIFHPDDIDIPTHRNPRFYYAILRNIEKIISSTGKVVIMDNVMETSN